MDRCVVLLSIELNYFLVGPVLKKEALHNELPHKRFPLELSVTCRSTCRIAISCPVEKLALFGNSFKIVVTVKPVNSNENFTAHLSFLRMML